MNSHIAGSNNFIREQFFINDIKNDIKKLKTFNTIDTNKLYSNFQKLTSKVMLLNKEVDNLNKKITLVKDEVKNNIKITQKRIKKTYKILLIIFSIFTALTIVILTL